MKVCILVDNWNGGKPMIKTDGPPTYQQKDPKKVDKDGNLVPRWQEVNVEIPEIVTPAPSDLTLAARRGYADQTVGG